MSKFFELLSDSASNGRSVECFIFHSRLILRAVIFLKNDYFCFAFFGFMNLIRYIIYFNIGKHFMKFRKFKYKNHSTAA